MSEPNPIQAAFDELLAKCAEREEAFQLRVFDGEHETAVVGLYGSGVVTMLDDVQRDLSGRVLIELDAKMLLRLLPALVRETHRALALVPKDEDDEEKP